MECILFFFPQKYLKLTVSQLYPSTCIALILSSSLQNILVCEFSPWGPQIYNSVFLIISLTITISYVNSGKEMITIWVKNFLTIHFSLSLNFSLGNLAGILGSSDCQSPHLSSTCTEVAHHFQRLAFLSFLHKQSGDTA